MASPNPSPVAPAAGVSRAPTKFKRSGTKTIKRNVSHDEEDVHRISSNVATVALTAKAVSDQHINNDQANRLKAGLTIPWYIIDPTGELIKEQRSNRSTNLQLDKQLQLSDILAAVGKLRPQSIFSKQRIAYWLVRCPTLYPGWDAITAIALIFTALVTPFEVGFMPPDRNPTSFLWITNRLIDLVFVFDMLFQFFTMRKMAVEKAVDSKAEWEMSVGVIAREYITSMWFYLDIMSIAPSVRRLAPEAAERPSAARAADETFRP